LQKSQWKERHAADVLSSMENDLFPTLGKKELQDIQSPELVDLLRKVQKRGAAETAFRLLQRISAVYRYAMACNLASFNPGASIGPALQPVVKRKQRAVLSISAHGRF
jgi:integrase